MPEFHIKIDTGMHRQGFLPHQTHQLIKLLNAYNLKPAGIYTHFASVKDPADPTCTISQLAEFKKIITLFAKAGFSAKGGFASGEKNMARHAAASGGTLLFPETYLDMVRIGMGLYGYTPSPEIKTLFLSQEKSKIKMQKSKLRSGILRPVLSWKTIVSEIKEIPKGAAVGYDLTERVSRPTTIAVLPVGYWHGFDRGLSSTGEVLIRGKRARVLGRVSMDMTVVDVTDVRAARVGDVATLIGKDGKEAIWADEIASKIGTTQYEVLTRLNPLIAREVIISGRIPRRFAAGMNVSP